MSLLPSLERLEKYEIIITPTVEEDIEGLALAYDDPALFDFYPYGVRSAPPAEGSVLAGLVDPGRLSLTIRSAQTNKIMGSTSVYENNEETRQISLGYTWFSKALHRTGVNQRCKLILLEWIFEELSKERVTLYVDNQNFPSQKAVLALGATHEGTLRHHARRKDGTFRDTYIYSILRSEWPLCKEKLLSKICEL